MIAPEVNNIELIRSNDFEAKKELELLIFFKLFENKSNNIFQMSNY
jgi:hypothetical protein